MGLASPSLFFRQFFRMFIGVVIFAVLHAFFFLPIVLVSVTPYCSCGRSKMNDIDINKSKGVAVQLAKVDSQGVVNIT